LALSGVAAAQPLPVEITAQGIFGDTVGTPSSESVLLVTAHNRSTHPLSGVIEVSNGYGSSGSARRMGLDLPPGATRTRLFPIRREGLSAPRIRYRVQGRDAARGSINLPYGGARGIVVMAESVSLRASLDGLSIEQDDPYGSRRSVAPPIGDVTMAATTGDPMLPVQPLGWSSVDLFVAEASMLERAGGPERRALEAWIRAGGTLLIFPRLDQDFELAYVRALLGRVQVSESDPQVIRGGASSLRPTGTSPELIGEAGTTIESFGLSAPLGFGRVYLASYNMAAPDIVNGSAPQQLVRAIMSRPVVRGVTRPLFSPSAGEEPDYGRWGASDPQALRSSLDPNESFRPALGLVAVVLLIYVFVVGPLNFGWVERRGKPMLALITTPIAASLCLLLLLAVGYVGKGTSMRYRRVQVAEIREGDTLGTSRAYVGLFAARPVSFDLDPPPLGSIHSALTDEAVEPEWVDVSDGRSHLKDLRAALWETSFLREDAGFDLGGEIAFVREGARLAQVQNHTRRELLGAVVIDGAGNVYPVGDIAPGGAATIPMSATLSLDENSTVYDRSDPRMGQLAEALGLDPREDQDMDAAFGVVRLAGRLTTAPLPSLWARLENEGTERIAGVFRREHELRLLRVLPSSPANPLQPGYYSSEPPMGANE